MAANDKVQRIKLRCDGSPVKWDATILETTPDAKRIKVRFDGPIDDAIMTAISDRRLVSDMKDKDGKPVDDYRMVCTCRMWEVL